MSPRHGGYATILSNEHVIIYYCAFIETAFDEILSSLGDFPCSGRQFAAPGFMFLAAFFLPKRKSEHTLE
jgi:hypothetical protein